MDSLTQSAHNLSPEVSKCAPSGLNGSQRRGSFSAAARRMRAETVWGKKLRRGQCLRVAICRGSGRLERKAEAEMVVAEGIW